MSLVNWDVNAFTLGARAVNPEVEVIATYANTWYDPGQGTPDRRGDAGTGRRRAGLQYVIDRRGSSGRGGRRLFDRGFQNDMSAAGPNGHLTSVIFQWDTYLTPTIQKMIAGEWRSAGLPLVGMDQGINLADITPLSDAVPADARAKIEATRQAIIDGSFQVYSGPINKQSGDPAVAAGETLTTAGLWGMDYFVEGIIGTMPKSE